MGVDVESLLMLLYSLKRLGLVITTERQRQRERERERERGRERERENMLYKFLV